MNQLTIHCTKSGLRVAGAKNVGSTSDNVISTRSQFMRVAEHWWNTYCEDGKGEAVTPTHNPLAIREALVRCADIINKFGLAEIVTTPMEVICDIEGIITAALSAPPRNCDIYDAESCRMAYHLHGDGLMTMQAFADWLFAPVEEGATNEQK